MKKKNDKEKIEPVKKELSWTRKDQKKTPSIPVSAIITSMQVRNFIGRGFKMDIFQTTLEQLTQKWREVRVGRLSVVKSAMWSDEESWSDLLEWLKACLVDPPEEQIQFAFEMFSGGIQIGFVVDWSRSQLARNGSIVLLRGYEPIELSFGIAPSDQYREGFRIEGLTNAHGARLVIAAAQLPAT